MQKETIIAQELFSYSMIERFDSACCRLLANKPILAWLLRDTVKDYQSCSIEEYQSTQSLAEYHDRIFPGAKVFGWHRKI